MMMSQEQRRPCAEDEEEDKQTWERCIGSTEGEGRREGDPGNLTTPRSDPGKVTLFRCLSTYDALEEQERTSVSGTATKKALISFIKKTSDTYTNAGRWPSWVSWSRVMRESVVQILWSVKHPAGRRLVEEIDVSRGMRIRWDACRCMGTLEDFLILSQLFTNDSSRGNRRVFLPSIWDLDDQETFTSQRRDSSKESSVIVERKDHADAFLFCRAYCQLWVVKSTDWVRFFFCYVICAQRHLWRRRWSATRNRARFFEFTYDVRRRLSGVYVSIQMIFSNWSKFSRSLRRCEIFIILTRIFMFFEIWRFSISSFI